MNIDDNHKEIEGDSFSLNESEEILLEQIRKVKYEEQDFFNR